MFSALATIWMIGSITMLVYVILARRRRSALARELHEMRGALTSARLAVDLSPGLADGESPHRRTAADELERTACTLGDFERLLHRPLIAPPAPSVTRLASEDVVDLRDELERLAVIWRAAALECGREFEFVWGGPEGGVQARCSRKCFAEVVTNLLSNALRHGEGTIKLSAQLRCDSMRVEVADSGPGLPGPLSGVLRRPHRREHGHGLSIARASARSIGGELSAAPTAQGARFVFILPAIHDTSKAALAPLGRGER